MDTVYVLGEFRWAFLIFTNLVYVEPNLICNQVAGRYVKKACSDLTVWSDKGFDQSVMYPVWKQKPSLLLCEFLPETGPTLTSWFLSPTGKICWWGNFLSITGVNVVPVSQVGEIQGDSTTGPVGIAHVTSDVRITDDYTVL